MHSHQAHIGEYCAKTEEHILNKIQLWDANSLLLKEYTYFLSSSLQMKCEILDGDFVIIYHLYVILYPVAGF